MSMFSAPASAGVVKPSEIQGHLAVFEPIEYRPEVVTSMGTTSAVSATVHDLDADGGPLTTEGALFFALGLIGALQPRIGEKVLGRIGQGTAKLGMSAPWILIDATGSAADVARATAYLESYAKKSFTPPAQSIGAAPASAPAGNDWSAPLAGSQQAEAANVLASLTDAQRAALAGLSK